MPKFLPVEGAPDHVKVGTLIVPVTFGRRKEEGPISFRATIGGHGQRTIATGLTDVKEAIKRAEHIVKFLVEHQEAPRDPAEFEEFAWRVFDAKAPMWRWRTELSAKNHIGNFLIPYFKGRHVGDISDEDWGKFVSEILVAFPGRDLRNTRKYMRMIMRRARNANLTQKTLLLEIPPSKSSPGLWISKDGVEALLKASRPRLQLQILMAYLMIMRESEIFALEWERVDLERSLIHLFPEHVKTKQPRSFGIHPMVLELLLAWKRVSTSRYVFPLKDGRDGHVKSHQKEWTKARRDAHIQCRFHDLRHSGISEMIYVLKKNPADVVAYGGLSLDELKTYAHPKPDNTREIASALSVQIPLKLVAGKAEAP
jgi:integrase